MYCPKNMIPVVWLFHIHQRRKFVNFNPPTHMNNQVDNMSVGYSTDSGGGGALDLWQQLPCVTKRTRLTWHGVSVEHRLVWTPQIDGLITPR